MGLRGLTDDGIVFLVPSLDVGHHAMREGYASFDGGILKAVDFADDARADASERKHGSHADIHDEGIAVIEQHLVLLKVGGNISVVVQAAAAQLSSAVSKR